MKIYTKTGDKGMTSLFNGDRVPKINARVEAYGTLDELNSWCGYARSISDDTEIDKSLNTIQKFLHRLCSDLATPVSGDNESNPVPRITDDEVVYLEKEIDRMDEDLKPLTNFILPGGNPAGASLHIMRTVCRRAERRVHEIFETDDRINGSAVRFLNRLSDYLFTLARYANHRAGVSEKIWEAGNR